MKKTCFFLLAICLLTGTACEKEKEPNSKSGKITISEDEYIVMTILPEMISSNLLNKWIIENHTKNDMIYGTPFSLEYFNKNSWAAIQLDIEWEDIGLTLLAGKTTEGEINLYSLVEKYNNSKKGKYRIIKNIIFQNIGSYNLCAEFEII